MALDDARSAENLADNWRTYMQAVQEVHGQIKRWIQLEKVMRGQGLNSEDIRDQLELEKADLSTLWTNLKTGLDEFGSHMTVILTPKNAEVVQVEFKAAGVMDITFQSGIMTQAELREFLDYTLSSEELIVIEGATTAANDGTYTLAAEPTMAGDVATVTFSETFNTLEVDTSSSLKIYHWKKYIP